MGQQCCHPPPTRHRTHTYAPAETKKGGSRRDMTGCKNGAGDRSSPCTTPLSEVLEDWKIIRSDLVFTSTTARDFFGSSWQGKWKNTEVEIRAVTLNKEGAGERLQEAELLKGLYHPNLLNVLGVCTEETEVYIVAERPLDASLLLPGLMERVQVGLPLHLHVLAQVASGLAYLEEHNLVHLEVAARNVLVTKALACKLMVCGIVQKCSDTGDVCISDSVTMLGLASEVAEGGSVTIKSSVWAFALFMLEVVQGDGFNFHAFITNQKMKQKSRDGEHNFPCPLPLDNCPPDLHELVKKCWADLPKNRPTFASLRDSLKDQADRLREELTVYLESDSELWRCNFP